MTENTEPAPIRGNFRSLEAIKRANAEAGYYWFSPATLRGFGSQISESVYGGCLFVSSEQPPDGPRAYAVRVAHADGSVGDVTETASIGSRDTAHRIAARIAAELAGRPAGYCPCSDHDGETVTAGDLDDSAPLATRPGPEQDVPAEPAPMTYAPGAAPAVVATWAGGSHIDLSFKGDQAPFSNIGVYDYAAGRVRITTEAEFRAKVDAWVTENAEDLPKHFENHRPN